jgi:rhodanese-related sulfurtransferase
MNRSVSPAQVREALLAGGELALIDVREQGVHYQGHPFFACSMPLSRLELLVDDLLPRRTVPIVVLDSGHEGLAERASAKLAELGYTDIAILAGGCAGWAADGGELFSGLNVPSKAFGEFVEHEFDTPRIAPEELIRIQADGQPVVVLDARPIDEYRLMNIPGSINVPGAELAWRAHELAPDPETLVVVNCAGRTRSIIGCQSLRNAGLANRVVALKDGTMGWDLAGHSCERGSDRVAPPPGPVGASRAKAAAAQVAARFGVQFATAATVQAWQADPAISLYLLDVRTREEFERGRIPGSRHAPGGQVVQATDEFVGVQGAHVVLIDPEGVRSVLTASWLNQMGLAHVFVLEPDGLASWPVESGPPQRPAIGSSDVATMDASELAGLLDTAGLVVIDLATSLAYRNGHIPGAWWAVRARLESTRNLIGEPTRIVLTACEPELARLTLHDAREVWPKADITLLKGGNRSWVEACQMTETGFERATTAPDDIWYKPYELGDDYPDQARAYLEWEVALPDQVALDPTIRFRRYA